MKSSRKLNVSKIIKIFHYLENSTEFLKVLNSPVTKNHVELLNQLQNTEIGSCEHFYENLP